jgi:hypothetical protein
LSVAARVFCQLDAENLSTRRSAPECVVSPQTRLLFLVGEAREATIWTGLARYRTEVSRSIGSIRLANGGSRLDRGPDLSDITPNAPSTIRSTGVNAATH